MKNRKFILTFEISAFIVFSVFIISIIFGEIKLENFIFIFEKWPILIGVFLLFLVNHALRMFRLFILLMENRMRFSELFNLYVKATLINNILPFKIGEIYKFLLFGNKLNDMYKGFLLVWIDRFFDALVMSILAIFLIIKGNFSNVMIVIFLFVVLSIIIFKNFENTFNYFNKLLLTQSKSKNGIFYLKVIDQFKKIYNDSRELIRGRSMVLLFTSAIILISEYFLVFAFFNLLAKNFDSIAFFNYLNGAFFVENNASTDYMIKLISIVLLIIFLCFSFILRKRAEKDDR